MCGISGIISRNRVTEKMIQEVKGISAGLKHRGPDGERSYQHDYLFLSHRRLSIIDIEGGAQPLYSQDRSIVLIANGEIYNYIELRNKLEQEGVVFRTASDCEVIVHLYEKYGMDCLQYLRGMFSFCVWDNNKRKLFLVRDRMGEKPLYIFQNNELLLFSSEIKPLAKSTLVPFELNTKAINDYFFYHYIPEPQTAIKGVVKLSAGHFIEVDLDSWDIRTEKYWDMTDAEPIEGNPADLIRAELDRIGEIIVRSDVPVGVALSGGVDSSAVAALAAQNCKDKVQAYCVGYSGSPECDERRDAKKFAKYLNIPLHEIEIDSADMVDSFADLIAKTNDPIADISGFGYYSLMKAANNHGTKVLLQGQGADELFWGYPWMAKAVKENIERHSLSRKGKLIQSVKSEIKLPREASIKCIGKWGMDIGGVKSAINHYKRIEANAMNRLICYDLTPEYQEAVANIEDYYAPSFVEKVSDCCPSDHFPCSTTHEAVDVALTKFACQTYLLENGISQADRLSMSVSVESRLPFIDYKLVETVIGLRKSQEDYFLPPKAWFREALNGLVPDWVMNRPKRGFTPPVREWHKKIFHRYGDKLIDGCLVRYGVLSEEGARRLALGGFPLGVYVPISFKALVLELWLEEILLDSLSE